MNPAAADEPAFAEVVAISGVGLIGGSIAAALKARGFAGRVLGMGRSRERLMAARQAGVIDDVADDAVSADLIIVATPVDRIVDDVRRLAATLRSGALVTDAGSVKRAICRELATGLPAGVTFIGSHPLAGSEKRGFEHAVADLFSGRLCVITPNDNSPAEELARLRRFWEFVGMDVTEMTPAAHDRSLARTSHLPHLVAATLAAQLEDRDRLLAATGFRDTTRIAAGSPDVWTGIVLENADELLAALEDYERHLSSMRRAIEARDVSGVRRLLNEAKRRRDALD